VKILQLQKSVLVSFFQALGAVGRLNHLIDIGICLNLISISVILKKLGGVPIINRMIS